MINAGIPSDIKCIEYKNSTEYFVYSLFSRHIVSSARQCSMHSSINIYLELLKLGMIRSASKERRGMWFRRIFKENSGYFQDWVLFVVIHIYHGCFKVLWHCWLGVRKSIRSAKIEWWGAGVVICVERGTDCLHMVQLMPLHPEIPSSLASFISRLLLPFWYGLTQVVLEKRPLNWCSSSSSSSSVLRWLHSGMRPHRSTNSFLRSLSCYRRRKTYRRMGGRVASWLRRRGTAEFCRVDWCMVFDATARCEALAARLDEPTFD